MRVSKILVAAAVAASAVTAGAQPAAADHNYCGSGHGFQYNVPPVEVSTGTTDSFDPSDFWRDQPFISGESLRQITLQPVTGDTDLYVWSADCTRLICSSLAGTGIPDRCLINVSDATYIEARNWGGTSSQYTLTVAYSPGFFQ